MRQIYNSAESSPEMLRYNLLVEKSGPTDTVGCNSANNAFVPNCDVHNLLGSTMSGVDCSGDCFSYAAADNSGARNCGHLTLANLMPSRLEKTPCHAPSAAIYSTCISQIFFIANTELSQQIGKCTEFLIEHAHNCPSSLKRLQLYTNISDNTHI